MNILRRTILAGLAGLCLPFMGAVVAAQEFPTRPIRFIVPSGPGLTTDNVTRLVATKLTERTGWATTVENHAGGNLVIGTQHALNAPADGHTVLAAVSTHAILPSSTPDLPFDFLRDFRALTRTVSLQILLFANKDQPFKNVPEFIAHAKENPGKLSYGSLNAGSLTHLAGELLKLRAGIEMTNIPYRGEALLIDVISGVIPLGVTTLSTALPQIDAGNLVPLAVLGPKVSPLLPDVPTLAQAGGIEIDADGWLGLVIRAETPDDVTDKLYREIRAVLQLPEVQEQFEKWGAPGIPDDTPELYRAKLESDVATWADVIKRANITF